MLEDIMEKRVKLNQTALSSLKEFTVVVADTGRINDIQRFKPQDATTNPSLILDAAKQPEYSDLINEAIKQAIEQYQKPPAPVKNSKRIKKNHPQPQIEIVNQPLVFKELAAEKQKQIISLVCDHLSVIFGVQILKIVPGYVSTEIDARLSYDKQAMIEKAKQIIQLYEQTGISKDRILIKIASTWEGIQAAKALKKEGITCNMTLIFNYHQAIACAQAGVKLISPFVGRILDWFKKQNPTGSFQGEDHPGVKMVTKVFNYFKKHNHDTIIMAASLRLVEEVEFLSGCDRMTIPSKLLDELQTLEGRELPSKLNSESAQLLDIHKEHVDEKTYRWSLNQDAMANDKLAEGIRNFAADTDKLELLIRDRLESL